MAGDLAIELPSSFFSSQNFVGFMAPNFVFEIP